MKKLHLLGLGMLALVLASCGSSKNVPIETTINKQTSLEGEKVVVEETVYSGVEMVDDLSEDGTQMVKVAYKWYAGIGKADDKQTAIEMAELEARATISRIMQNAVLAESERGSVVNNGAVQKALTSHWQQVSMSIQNACEPFGKTRIEYSQTTRMYTVTQKVGIRGDKFQKMLNSAGNYKPNDLQGEELKQFIEVNKSIMEAAKGGK